MKYKSNFEKLCNKMITKCGKVWILMPIGVRWNDFFLKNADGKINVLTYKFCRI